MRAYKNEGGSMKDDTRLALLEQSIDHINQSLGRIEQTMGEGFRICYGRFNEIDNKLDKIESKHDQKIEGIQNRLWSLFIWMVSGFAGVLALVAHALHWI